MKWTVIPMNRRIVIIIILFVCAVFVLSINAEDAIITVIVPKSTTAAITETMTSSIPKLQPVSVTEHIEDTLRSIVKTYELSPHDRLSDLSLDSFDYNGWHYELADITEKSNVEQKNHVETVTVNSETNDFDVILKLLSDTKEYTDGDFTGILTLGVESIIIFHNMFLCQAR